MMEVIAVWIVNFRTPEALLIYPFTIEASCWEQAHLLRFAQALRHEDQPFHMQGS